MTYIVDDIAKGYITGFYDSEGMVRIESNGILTVLIHQTYKPVLERIDCVFKSTSGVTVHSKGTDGRKDAWRWRLYSDDTIQFLEFVYPNSIEKRKQIELALKYQKEIKTSHKNNRSGGLFRLSQLEIEQRTWFKEELERLKHEKIDNQSSINYDNEIKLMKIPKDIREGKQMSLIPLNDLYKTYDIDINCINQQNNNIIEAKTINQNMSKDVNIGYLSGFFDGEEYIGITKGKRNDYTLRIGITNSNFNILKIFEEQFGGKIRPLSKKYKESDKKLYQYGINHSYALKFLNQIQNCTIVKQRQIQVAIEFQEWHNQINIIKTQEQKQKAEWYYNTLKELKQENGETDNSSEYEPQENENSDSLLNY